MNSAIKRIAIYVDGISNGAVPPPENNQPSRWIDFDEETFIVVLEDAYLESSPEDRSDYDTGWQCDECEEHHFRVSQHGSITSVEVRVFTDDRSDTDIVSDTFKEVYSSTEDGITALMKRWNISKERAESVVSAIVDEGVIRSDIAEYVWGVIVNVPDDAPGMSTISDLALEVFSIALVMMDNRYLELEDICRNLNVWGLFFEPVSSYSSLREVPAFSEN